MLVVSGPRLSTKVVGDVGGVWPQTLATKVVGGVGGIWPHSIYKGHWWHWWCLTSDSVYKGGWWCLARDSVYKGGWWCWWF